MSHFDSQNARLAEISRMSRAVKDLQAQSEKLETSPDFDSDLYAFSRFAIELRRYIVGHFQHEKVLIRMNELPDLELIFSRKKAKSGIFFLIGSIWGSLAQIKQKEEMLNHVRDVASIFASTEFVIKSIYG